MKRTGWLVLWAAVVGQLAGCGGSGGNSAAQLGLQAGESRLFSVPLTLGDTPTTVNVTVADNADDPQLPLVQLDSAEGTFNDDRVTLTRATGTQLEGQLTTSRATTWAVLLDWLSNGSRIRLTLVANARTQTGEGNLTASSNSGVGSDAGSGNGGQDAGTQPTVTDPETPAPDDLTVAASNTVVAFNNTAGLPLRGRLVTPAGSGPLPALVVLHGCQGLWDDAANWELKGQFEDWAAICQDEGFVALFVDSFGPRNLPSFCAKAPPDDAVCSPAYERTKDAFGALHYLRGLAYVDAARIGVLGFSHGAETTIAALVDTAYVAQASWTVKSAGVTYPVPAPQAPPAGGGFACGVAYYPGCGFYSYWGSPSNASSGKYRPTAPLAILHAAKDPLYTSGYPTVLVQKAVNGGAAVSNGNPLTLQAFADANHSFDGKTTGADGTASTAARTVARAFFNQHLRP